MSPNKNYVNGRAFEYRVIQQIESQYPFVSRTPGSKNKRGGSAKRTKVDIVAINREQVSFIQCKSGGAKITKAERDALLEIANECGAIPYYAHRENRQVVIERLEDK